MQAKNWAGCLEPEEQVAQPSKEDWENYSSWSCHEVYRSQSLCKLLTTRTECHHDGNSWLLIRHIGTGCGRGVAEDHKPGNQSRQYKRPVGKLLCSCEIALAYVSHP
jgi:hypothetical protein